MIYKPYLDKNGSAFIYLGGVRLRIYSPWDKFYYNPEYKFSLQDGQILSDYYHAHRDEYIAEIKKLLVKEML